MKILVCGGRNYAHVVRTKPRPEEEDDYTQERLSEYKHIHDVLHGLIMKYSKERNDEGNWLPTDITIITGAAKGADTAASEFAIVNYCQLKEYPADWDRHGVRAGYIRNQQMLDEGKPDLVVAFPGGRGTKMMVKLAKDAGIPVLEA